MNDCIFIYLNCRDYSDLIRSSKTVLCPLFFCLSQKELSYEGNYKRSVFRRENDLLLPE